MILSLLRVKDFEMEDMMRSSFAEFHAQKAQPDVVRQRDAAKQQLQALRDKPWPSGPGRCARGTIFVEVRNGRLSCQAATITEGLLRRWPAGNLCSGAPHLCQRSRSRSLLHGGMEGACACRPGYEDAQAYVQLEQRANDLLSSTIASIAQAKPWLDAIRPGAVALVRPSDDVSTELAAILGTAPQVEALFQEVHDVPADSWRKRDAQSADATVYVLTLHEPHQTDAADARSGRQGAGSADFAGFKRVQKKWSPPALPMCAGSP